MCARTPVHSRTAPLLPASQQAMACSYINTPQRNRRLPRAVDINPQMRPESISFHANDVLILASSGARRHGSLRIEPDVARRQSLLVPHPPENSAALDGVGQTYGCAPQEF